MTKIHREERRRVMVLGLDGATWELLDRLFSRGLMPNLQALTSQGARGPLWSVVPPMTATAWTSFATGKGPGKHGIYDWTEPMDGSYVYEPVDSRRVNSRTLFEVLSDHGLRSATVNLPLTYPCRPLDGVAVSGMLTPSTEVSGFTYPPEFVDTIRTLCPDYVIDTHLTDSFEDVLPFLERLETMLHERTRLLLHLLEQEDWDLFVTVFVEMDRMQHCVWQFIDEDHAYYDAEGAARYADRIFAIYKLMDDKIGELVAAKGPDCDVVFISDHGFGPCRAKVFLNTWLAQEGLLVFKEGGQDVRGHIHKVRTLLGRAGVDTRRILEAAKALGAEKFVQRQGASFSRFAASIDWEQTVAYCHGTNSVRINLAGREPEGSVAPEDYEAVRERVRTALLAMKDSDGESVISDVQTREELYSGPEVGRAADLLIAGHDESVWFYYSEGEIPDVVFEAPGWASGNHKANGIFLGHGPSFAEGIQVDDPNIIDIFPTLLAILGVPIPDDQDGRILRHTFREGFRPRVLWKEAAHYEGSTESVFSAKEKAEIEERLRGLGYLQ